MEEMPEHKNDIPDEENSLTAEKKSEHGALCLQRFCFLGNFEPVKTHRVGTINVKHFGRPLSEFCKLVKPAPMLTLLETAYKSMLYRRDEVALVHAMYLCDEVAPLHKTAVRRNFPSLVANDKDLFLFCKYAAILHREMKQAVFNKTVKKALTDWYTNQSAENMAYMFGNNRGRHGFTHKSLIRMCHIPDGVLGTRHIYRSLTQNCTLLLRLRDIPLVPTNPKVRERLAKTAKSKVKIEKKTEENVEVKLEGRQDAETPTIVSTGSTTSTDDATLEELGLLPTEEQNRIQEILLAISALRTTGNVDEALALVQEHNFKYEHLPYNMLQHSPILKTVASSISCLQFLDCIHSEKIRKHFAKQEILKVIRDRFQRKGGLKDENVDPIMFLMNMDRLSIREPLKPTNNRKTIRGRLVQFSKQLYKISFYETKPLNLRIHITMNMQPSYLRKILKNTKNITYQFGAVALSFAFFKVEPDCEVYRYTEQSSQLQRIEWDKKMEFLTVHNLASYIPNNKQKQRLYAPILQANKKDRIYDLFIVIVPSGARGNKRRASKALAAHLANYRKNNNTTTKFVIVNLLRYKHSMSYSTTTCENILEICGLDKHTIPLIHNFALNRFS